MNRYLKLCVVGLLAGLTMAAAGCTKLEARDQLNRGVTAFKSASFNEAIGHFQKAIQLDPTLVNAKIYLATAYQSQFIPGAPTPDNMNMANQALAEYQQVLDQDPNNANAVVGMARLNYDMGNLDQAQADYQRALTISPMDPDAYYTLGAIAYQKTHKGILAARQAAGVTEVTAPLVGKKAKAPTIKACKDLSAQDAAIIDDGIAQLEKAIQLRPTYDDAMTYLNLLYRDKGDLACGNTAARDADVKIADNYAARGLAERKAAVAAANSKSSGGVVVDESGQPTSDGNSQ